MQHRRLNGRRVHRHKEHRQHKPTFQQEHQRLQTLSQNHLHQPKTTLHHLLKITQLHTVHERHQQHELNKIERIILQEHIGEYQVGVESVT